MVWGGKQRRVSLETPFAYLWFDGAGDFGFDAEEVDIALPNLTIPMFGMNISRLMNTLRVFKKKKIHDSTILWWDCNNFEKASSYRHLSQVFAVTNPSSVLTVKGYTMKDSIIKNPYNLGLYLLMLSSISRWTTNLRSFKDSVIEFELGALDDHDAEKLGEIALWACVKSFAEALSDRRKFTLPDSEVRGMLWRFFGIFTSGKNSQGVMELCINKDQSLHLPKRPSTSSSYLVKYEIPLLRNILELFTYDSEWTVATLLFDFDALLQCIRSFKVGKQGVIINIIPQFAVFVPVQAVPHAPSTPTTAFSLRSGDESPDDARAAVKALQKGVKRVFFDSVDDLAGRVRMLPSG